MKTFLAMLLALVMVFALAACGGDEKPAETPAEAPAEGEAAEAPEASEETASDLKVSVFWYDESDVYLSTVRDALNKELDAAGVKYDNQFAAGNQSKQIDQIKTAIAGGSNLLVVNVVTSGSPDTAEDIISIAGDIPVVFFNRALGTNDNPDLPVYEAHDNVCFIGTDAPEAGHMQGKMVGDYVLANYDDIDLNKDGKISYAMFKGDESNVEAIYRTQFGVEDADKILTAAGKPALEYFDAANTDKYQVDLGGAWSAKAATDYMTTNLVTYNEGNGNMIELVICNNDGMAEGVVATLQNNGYNTADKHVIPVFGVDATDNAKSLIADGAMTGTVKQDAEGMAAAIRMTIEALAAGNGPVDALATLSDERFTIAPDCSAKLYVAYAPYTGE